MKMEKDNHIDQVDNLQLDHWKLILTQDSELAKIWKLTIYVIIMIFQETRQTLTELFMPNKMLAKSRLRAWTNTGPEWCPQPSPRRQPSLSDAPTICVLPQGEPGRLSLSAPSPPIGRTPTSHLHGHINTQGVSTSMRREPRPSLPGGPRHRCPRHFDTPLDPDPEVSGAHTPLEPLVTHRASRVCGRRLRPARSRRSPRTCRASPRRCELPPASARPRAAESAARGWSTPRVGAAAPGLADVGASEERGRKFQRPDAGPRRRLRFLRRPPSGPGPRPGPATGGLPAPP
ncbi:proline-rich protein 2-like [Mustela erminea]|uniref:proline-rich protein 2-like n=1 Tax=Mustela erminea TaxID=36723 RepID=UPI0013867A27|nr:proline-rich protein 2-like [Mustela erminea]